MAYARRWRMRSYHWFDNCFLSGVKAIINAAEKDGITICGPNGEGKPKISFGNVMFNGSKAKNEDYEAFGIGRCSNTNYDFCKTARQPYDSVVGAVLKLALEYGYVYNVGSDGDNEEAEVDKLYQIGKEVADGIWHELPY